MAHKKAGGTVKNLRDSKPKYLGTKLYDGELVKIGNVIVRQRGTRILPGRNVSIGVDHTLFARANGIIKFGNKRKVGFNQKVKNLKVVHIIPT